MDVYQKRKKFIAFFHKVCNYEKLKGPFIQTIFVKQLNAIFVALNLQPAVISSRFCKTSVHVYRLFFFYVRLLKSETATQRFMSCISNRGNKLPKISLKSQLVYTCDFEELCGNFSTTKITLSCATKIACVNEP